MILNLMKASLVLMALGSLAGCASRAEITSPQVALNYSDSFDKTRLKWASYPIAFRSYVEMNEDGEVKLREVVDAQCQLKSKEFQASFKTPALVDLPVVKGRPSVAQLSCKVAGKSGLRKVAPFTEHTVVIGDPLTMLVGNIATGIAASRNLWVYSYRGEMIGILLE